MSSLQEQVLEATENLKDEYIIGRGAHGIVYKAIIGQQCTETSNQILDNNMEPIIAGTALCKKLFQDSNSHSETRKRLSSHVVGTPGYIAPVSNTAWKWSFAR
ncbi:receptor-like protein kinase [Trifolium pratense]|uniref:Receptor-like protein kinase n=1 Tax=Trifolium pratense TaxID=57577 RepID=A0A2K3LN05_TRIPR|nr:receptor-like protein kinase [Trifolium pratense]